MNPRSPASYAGENDLASPFPYCRGGRIRTYDLMVPNHARYRTTLHPDGVVYLSGRRDLNPRSPAPEAGENGLTSPLPVNCCQLLSRKWDLNPRSPVTKTGENDLTSPLHDTYHLILFTNGQNKRQQTKTSWYRVDLNH